MTSHHVTCDVTIRTCDTTPCQDHVYICIYIYIHALLVVIPHVVHALLHASIPYAFCAHPPLPSYPFSILHVPCHAPWSVPHATCTCTSPCIWSTHTALVSCACRRSCCVCPLPALGRHFKRWKKRWFVLQDSTLYSFKKEKVNTGEEGGQHATMLTCHHVLPSHVRATIPLAHHDDI